MSKYIQQEKEWGTCSSKSTFSDSTISSKTSYSNSTNSTSATSVLSNKYPYNLKKSTVDESLLFEIALAGFKRSEINIKIVSGKIKVSAIKPININEYGRIFKDEHIGISYRDFNATYIIHPSYDVTSVKSDYKNGLLTLRISLKDEEQIDIKIG